MKKDSNHVNWMFSNGEAEVFSLLHSNNASPGYYWDSSSDKQNGTFPLLKALVRWAGGMGWLKQKKSKSTWCWSAEEFCLELSIVLLSGPVACVLLAGCWIKCQVAEQVLKQDSCIGCIGRISVKVVLGGKPSSVLWCTWSFCILLICFHFQ